MKFLLKLSPKIRLILPIVLGVLSILGFYLLWNYETPLVGFITGVIVAFTLLVILTLEKE